MFNGALGELKGYCKNKDCECDQLTALSESPNIGALIIRVGLWGIIFAMIRIMTPKTLFYLLRPLHDTERRGLNSLVSGFLEIQREAWPEAKKRRLTQEPRMSW